MSDQGRINIPINSESTRELAEAMGVLPSLANRLITSVPEYEASKDPLRRISLAEEIRELFLVFDTSLQRIARAYSVVAAEHSLPPTASETFAEIISSNTEFLAKHRQRFDAAEFIFSSSGGVAGKA